MSDQDSEDENESIEESSESEKDDESFKNDNDETEEVDEAIKLKMKQENVKTDIDMIKDIFYHIDQTTTRITNSIKLKNELNQIIEENKEREKFESNVSDRKNLSWSQYEYLDEAERAELLERAILALK